MKIKNVVEDSPRKKTDAKDESKVNSVDESIKVEKQVNVVVVHATTVIENTPGEILTQADATHLKNLIFRENTFSRILLNWNLGDNKVNSETKHSSTHWKLSYLCQHSSFGKGHGPIFGSI